MRMRAGLLMLLLLLLLLLLVWRHPWCRAQASSFLRRRLGRFSLQIDQAQAAAHLRDVDEIFGRCGMDFWLTEGTALGAVRDGRVIPTDTDIDVGVRDGRALRACAAAAAAARLHGVEGQAAYCQRGARLPAAGRHGAGARRALR